MARRPLRRSLPGSAVSSSYSGDIARPWAYCNRRCCAVPTQPSVHQVQRTVLSSDDAIAHPRSGQQSGDLEGPFPVGSNVAEIFEMEYANNMDMTGWAG